MRATGGRGGFPAVTLAQARQKAREAHSKIDAGIDPVLERQQAKSALRAAQVNAITFAQAARMFIDAKSAEWSNDKHRQQWDNTIDTYANPVMGSLLVSDVGQSDVLAVLEPIWLAKTQTATRLRGRIEQMLDWARVRGFREGENPARWRGHLDKLLARPNKIMTVEHHKAVSIDAVSGFMSDLRARKGLGTRALELLTLTAVRSGEVRGATWAEIDLDGRVWTVPADCMKAKEEHRVPLSQPAITLLRDLPRFVGSDLIFPSSKGTPMSDMTLTALMRRMETGGVPHGLRSSFRDRASERTAYPSEMAEMALAHAEGNKTEAAYRRGDLFEKRRRMMEDWARFCDSPAGSTGKIMS